MSTTLQDLDSLTQDYCGNYSTGTSRESIRYRAINRAIEYIKRNLSIPNDEEIYSFWFTQDQFFYDAPAKMVEGLQLLYNNPLSNTSANKWEFYNYPQVIQDTGGSRKNRWSVTSMNGRKQIVMVGYNSLGGQVLLPMDVTTDWTASDDASGLAADSIIKYDQTASLSFDITNSSGTATLSRTNLNLDLQELFNRHGFLKFYAFMSDNDIDSVALKLISSSGNYYTLTVTEQDNGQAFVQDEWQKLGFHTDDALATGSPDLTGITQIDIEFDLGSGFVSAVDFRIDSLFSVFAEKMDMIYLSETKGTDSTGATTKTELSSADDILWFSGDFDDYTDIIAKRAAINLWPQLRGDKEQYMMLKQEFRGEMKDYARRWPRKRVQGSYRHRLAR